MPREPGAGTWPSLWVREGFLGEGSVETFRIRGGSARCSEIGVQKQVGAGRSVLRGRTKASLGHC